MSTNHFLRNLNMPNTLTIMQRFLILSLFYIITINPLLGQSDTLFYPKFDTTEVSEDSKIYSGKYTNDNMFHRDRASMDTLMFVRFGLGPSQVFIKDNLISPHSYRGFGYNLSGFFENGKQERWRGSLGVELIYQRLQNDFTKGGVFYDDLLPVKRLEYMEVNIPFEYNFRLAKSPHYLGFQFSYNLVGVDLWLNGINLSPSISDHYISAGAAYFYRDEIFGIPIRAKATLPFVALGFHNQYNRFTTLSNYFRPEVQIDVFAKKTKKGYLTVSYQAKYFNTNRGVDLAFRQRYFQNLINVSYAWFELW